MKLLLCILIRVAQDDVVLVHGGDVFDPTGKLRVEDVGDIRDDDSDSRRLLARKTTCNRIRTVAESIDDLKYLLPCCRLYVGISVDHT